MTNTEGFVKEPPGAASSMAPLLMSSLFKVSVFSAILCAIYLCGLSTYRLFLHPLRKYPGPRLASITAWYPAISASRGVYYQQVLAWHETYGPVVRISPNKLSFNTHESYVEIYGVWANNSKDESYAAMSASRTRPNLLTAREKAVANHKRRIYSRLFAPQGLKRVEQRVIDQVNLFVSSLVATPAAPRAEEKVVTACSWSTPVNLTERCVWLTSDIATDLAYSQSLDMQVSKQNRHFTGLFRFMTWRAAICVVQPLFYKLHLDKLMLASSIRQMRQLGTYAIKRTRERLQSPDGESDDLYRAMMAAGGEKVDAKFDEKEYFVEALLLMGTGSIISGPTLSSAFFFLAHYPDALARLTSEIRSKFDTMDDIRAGPALNQCNFLRACVDETMRMIPGIANILPRVVSPGGMVVEGEQIPEGTQVGCSLYALHRNPNYFRNPDNFQPERWMSGDSLVPPETRKAFFPFSYGPRTCPGAHLALAELYLAVARVVFVYDMRLAPDAPCCGSSLSGRCTDRQFTSFVGLDLDGPMVQFRAREQYAS